MGTVSVQDTRQDAFASYPPLVTACGRPVPAPCTLPLPDDIVAGGVTSRTLPAGILHIP